LNEKYTLLCEATESFDVDFYLTWSFLSGAVLEHCTMLEEEVTYIFSSWYTFSGYLLCRERNSLSTTRRVNWPDVPV
jgi:hypothetical protein